MTIKSPFHIQPGFCITVGNGERISAEKPRCLAAVPFSSDQHSSESGSEFDSMEAKDSRRTDFCLAHGKICNWEPCHHKRRSCKKWELPAYTVFPSHQEWGLSCTKARFHPLIAGSILSFCEIGASNCSCVSPSKMSFTFQKESPGWHVTLPLVCQGNQHFHVSLVLHVPSYVVWDRAFFLNKQSNPNKISTEHKVKDCRRYCLPC